MMFVELPSKSYESANDDTNIYTQRKKYFE
jgi:hypothetical protein